MSKINYKVWDKIVYVRWVNNYVYTIVKSVIISDHLYDEYCIDHKDIIVLWDEIRKPNKKEIEMYYN